MKRSLSALIIAKDEQRDLPRCLASLRGVATETVVLVDAATSDRTEDIARAAGATVQRRAFDDYARQRQAALDVCTGEWVLWIDCDESLDRRLQAAIESRLEAPEADAYTLRFSVRFMGRVLRFGGFGGETHVRLFRREKARFVGGALHEGLEIAGRTAGPLDGKVEHEPYDSLSEYLQKLDRYTTLAAQKKWDAGVRFRWWHHLVLPGELAKRLLLRGAFLDGAAGVSLGCLSAFHHWLKYAKLKEMEAGE